MMIITSILKKVILFIFISVPFICVHDLYAQKTQNITITDNVNPAGTKYYCYHRTYGGTYGITDRKDLGTSKTYAWVLNAPVAIGTHYWICRAYILEGTNLIEAVDSNEIAWVNTPAAVTIVGTIAAIGKKDAILQAKTNVPLSTVITYSVSGLPNSTLTKVVSSSPKEEHSILLDKLRHNTTYMYSWLAVDPTTGQTYTFNGTFTTL